jgi:hypothetical protein
MTVMLPDEAHAGDSGHVKDHNDIVAAIRALEALPAPTSGAMAYKGDYLPNAYKVGDTVRWQGELWVCVQDVDAGASAPVAPFWEKVTTAGTTATVSEMKNPVASAADLPATGNTIGDVRITLDDGHMHVWVAPGSWSNIGPATAHVDAYTKTESDGRYATLIGLTSKWTRWTGTQAEYDAITPKDAGTMYVVVTP